MADKLTLNLQAMKLAAASWGKAADDLRAGVETTKKLEITASEAGTFADALSKYQPAPGYFRDRLNEGVTVFEDIGKVLKFAADTYEAEDLASKGKLRNLEGEI
ncbi:Excreted virulence factor EspC, type VII ESX diderm [Nocardia amikacinitolerans]|uniref:type VII secretion target n=1 Tax=Nocardia amikacinitolerans TaxID=756689 RepID=UPI0020A54B64|nr:type VII secretion target [Nocardia amikacinitolerans]MCP2298405.1 Excreted virulence factor EspC, type VII ESX diderm [Nocardia amikacinitolerans]